MSNYHSNNVGFTSYQDWNAEPETSTSAPKSLAEQTAGTQVGRAMQLHAEERRDEVANYESSETESCRQQIFDLLDNSPALTVSKNGSVSLNPEASTIELAVLKEQLLDVKLPTNPEKRARAKEKIGELLAMVQEKLTPQKEEAEDKTAKAEIKTEKKPANTTESKPEVSAKEKVNRAKKGLTAAMKRLWDVQYKIKKAIGEKRYYALNELNQEAMVTSLEMLDELERLRTNDPDSLIDLVDENGSLENKHNAVGEVVIEFARTHNSFRFSPEMEKELAMMRLREYRNGNHRGKPSFTASLQEAYARPKDKDDPLSFMQRTTRIPKERFDRLIKQILDN